MNTRDTSMRTGRNDTGTETKNGKEHERGPALQEG